MPTTVANKYWQASFYTVAQKAEYQRKCEEQHRISKLARKGQSIGSAVRGFQKLLSMPELTDLVVRFSWLLWDGDEMRLQRRVILAEHNGPTFNDAYAVQGLLYLGSNGLWCAYPTLNGSEDYQKVSESQLVEVVQHFRIKVQELNEIERLIGWPAYCFGRL